MTMSLGDLETTKQYIAKGTANAMNSDPNMVAVVICGPTKLQFNKMNMNNSKTPSRELRNHI